MKPPFSYYGGKQRIASKICQLLPPHAVYVEPFCGGAAVMFSKGIPPGNSDYYREVLNDTNKLVINFYLVLQDPLLAHQLIDRIEYTLYSKDEYDLAEKICKQPIADMVDSAWAWFCNIQMSFGNVTNSGWGRGVFGRNLAVTFYNKRSALKPITDRMQSCHIESINALDCIKKWDSPQTLFYCDPPYPNTDQGCYKGYTQDDFVALIDALYQIKGSAVLSCYDNVVVPSGWVKHEFQARMSSANGKSRTSESIKRVECVWIKPTTEQSREMLLKPMKKNKLWIDTRASEQLSFLD